LDGFEHAIYYKQNPDIVLEFLDQEYKALDIYYDNFEDAISNSIELNAPIQLEHYGI
jgi:hypothetical protein